MTTTKNTLRGVQSIRTMSGRVDDNAIPYKGYMKLSVLEMEKHRRGVEKTCALEKVRKIDQRLQEIETEKQQILQAMAAPAGPAAPGRRRPVGRSSSIANTNTGSFKIKY